MKACEYDPINERPARLGDPEHAEAVLSVGVTNNWHLCAECAALPRFRAFTKRPLRAVLKAGGK